MKKRKKLLWRLYLSYLLIILISLLAIGWYTFSSVKGFHIKNLAKDLEARAHLVADLMAERYGPEDAPRVDALCKSIGIKIGTRFTVILPSGLVIADSRKNPKTMDNHADRLEIRQAISGQVGITTHYSHTLQKEMMYVAIPAATDGEVFAVVRASMPVPAIAQSLRSIYSEIALGGLVIALLAAALAFLVAQWINKPLINMKKGAERYAQGNLTYRLQVPDLEETGALAEAMNLMASQLDERIRTITRQRNELEAVLASMVEAVLMVDADQRIIRFNKAAGDLFRVNPDEAEGRNIQDIFRNVDLYRFIKKVFDADKPQEGDLVFHNGEDRYLQVHGTFIKDAQGIILGALVVLNDITHLKKLENIRRDFVANVSHELKTPITSIKGFVETLKDGAISDPDNAERFLDIIARQSDRLNSIIEDLLALSRIEQDEETGLIAPEEGRVLDVLESAILACQSKSLEKNIKVELDRDPEIRVRINQPLLEQAIVNLIDNAIKYSEAGSVVKIEARKADGELLIQVIDSGCGIPAEHLPRLFERFYRVDKARSRKMGGTGLGLAIVKHIVNAHGGRLAVQSTPGKGSIFSIYLPST